MKIERNEEYLYETRCSIGKFDPKWLIRCFIYLGNSAIIGEMIFRFLFALFLSPVVMSLVAKYARRDEDEEESVVVANPAAMDTDEANKKKRTAENEAEAPAAKKAKVAEPKGEKLELPDFFKNAEDPTTRDSSSEPTKTNNTSPKHSTLVPRQLRYVIHSNHHSTHFTFSNNSIS